MGNNGLWRLSALWGISAGLISLALVIGRLLPSEQLTYTAQYPSSAQIHLLDITHSFRFILASGELPLWSPDGSKLAYVSNTESGSEIRIIDRDGVHSRLLAASLPGDTNPVWSPDGSQLAFVSIRDNNPEIYITELCDEPDCDLNPHNLSHDPAIDTSPSWSPDGQHIAFLSMRTGKIEIYVMKPDGSDLRRLTQNSNAVLSAPQWSPDSSQLTYVSLRGENLDIFVMDATCGDLPDGCEGYVRNITQHPAMDMNPTWSPDGQWIAFTSRRDSNFEIYVVSSAGGAPRNLTNFPAEDRAPMWSPDSRYITFQSNRDKLFNDEIYLLDVTTGEQRRLTVSFGSSESAIWWPG